MAAPTYITGAEAIINVTVTGVTFPAGMFASANKSWSSWEGGDPSAAGSQLHPGGMAAAVALPGPLTRTNVTVKVPYTQAANSIYSQLEAAINQQMTASYTPTDANGNPNATAITRTGLLKEIQFPTFDAKSGEAVELALIMECNY
jgi:hypothetical protein